VSTVHGPLSAGACSESTSTQEAHPRCPSPVQHQAAALDPSPPHTPGGPDKAPGAAPAPRTAQSSASPGACSGAGCSFSSSQVALLPAPARPSPAVALDAPGACCCCCPGLGATPWGYTKVLSHTRAESLMPPVSPAERPQAEVGSPRLRLLLLAASADWAGPLKLLPSGPAPAAGPPAKGARPVLMLVNSEGVSCHAGACSCPCCRRDCPRLLACARSTLLLLLLGPTLPPSAAATPAPCWCCCCSDLRRPAAGGGSSTSM
jgi:hypothetical protein